MITRALVEVVLAGTSGNACFSPLDEHRLGLDRAARIVERGLRWAVLLAVLFAEKSPRDSSRGSAATCHRRGPSPLSLVRSSRHPGARLSARRQSAFVLLDSSGLFACAGDPRMGLRVISARR